MLLDRILEHVQQAGDGRHETHREQQLAAVLGGHGHAPTHRGAETIRSSVREVLGYCSAVGDHLPFSAKMFVTTVEISVPIA